MKSINIERILRQIAYYRLWPKVPAPPNIIHLEPSGGCNLKCITCPQSVADKTLISECLMDMATYDAILSQAAGFFKEMYFAVGGEPLLHPLLPEMISKAKKAGLSTTVHTNVTLMTRKKAEDIINSGLDKITLNIIDDKESYEKVRQGAKYEISLANIKNFLEAKKDIGSGPHTTIQSVKLYTPETGSAQPSFSPEFLKQFDGLPVDRTICIWAHHFAGDFADNATVDYSGPAQTKSYFPCTEIWNTMQVAWNGDVRPCCIDIQGVYVLGNIKTSTLRQLWNGEKMVALRKTLAGGKYENHPLCRNCDMLWRGGGLENPGAGSASKSIARLLSKRIKP